MKPEQSEKKKYPNLIPNNARSPEELREMGRKGGIKSGESRRRRRDFEKRARMMAQVIAELPEVKERFREMAELFGREK